MFALVPVVQSQTYQGRELVKAQLLADTNAVVPGKPFTVGLLLRMAPHWHTYWKFSGDAGIPTELKWKLPPGWKAGEIQWPIPLKTIDPGDIQTYGYQDEVLLMQEITPPARIDNSPVKLSADATWLVCEKICIPGNASLQLELPKSTTSASANTEIFTRFRPFARDIDFPLLRLSRRDHFESDAVRAASHLAQNFRIHPASGPKSAEDLAQRNCFCRWHFCLVHRPGAALDRTESRRSRDHLGR